MSLPTNRTSASQASTSYFSDDLTESADPGAKLKMRKQHAGVAGIAVVGSEESLGDVVPEPASQPSNNPLSPLITSSFCTRVERPITAMFKPFEVALAPLLP